MPCRRFIVTGRVQGVFFRASTQQVASEAGLTGWVRNLADGSVEVVASGGGAELKRLHQWLRQGPQFAQVKQVVAEDLDPQQASVRTGGFEVR